MSLELLDKTRKINRLLHNSPSPRIPFKGICQTIGDMMQSNTVIIWDDGRIAGEYIYNNQGLIKEIHLTEGKIDRKLNERLLGVLSTKENVNLTTLGMEGGADCGQEAILVPVEIAGRRLGTFFIYRKATGDDYGIDDIIMCEYAANIIGMEMIREAAGKDEEREKQKKTVNAAMHTLSLSETEAMLEVFDQLENKEGLIVVGRIAERVGITRTVLVNALRKFESAGILQTRSSGMKGTYIKILIPEAYEYLKRFR